MEKTKTLLAIMFTLTLACGLLFTVACTPYQPPIAQMVNAFQESELEPYAKPGTATITGQAFLKTRGGEVKYGAACEVILWPATPYFEERFDIIYLKKNKNGWPAFTVPEMDEDAKNKLPTYERTTIADGFGNFEFKNLPAGKYLLRCSIAWEVPATSTYVILGLNKTGGTAFAKATVSEGETVKVIVTIL